MKKTAIRVLFCAAMALTARESVAEAAFGVHGGTLGLGGSVTVGVTERLNVRGILNTFTYEYDDEASDVEYEFDLDLGSFGGMLDWHPGGGGFRISGGFFFNNNKVNGTGVPAMAMVEIGNELFDSGEVGTLTSELEFNDTAPYLGLGWGNAVGQDRRVRFSLDVGVLFQGEPDVEFRSTGANPLLQDQIDAQIAAEEADIQSDVDQFDLYPVISLGISIKL